MLLDKLEDLQHCIVRYILLGEWDFFAHDLLLRRPVLCDVPIDEEPIEFGPDCLPICDAYELGTHAVRSALKRS